MISTGNERLDIIAKLLQQIGVGCRVGSTEKYGKSVYVCPIRTRSIRLKTEKRIEEKPRNAEFIVRGDDIFVIKWYETDFDKAHDEVLNFNDPNLLLKMEKIVYGERIK